MQVKRIEVANFKNIKEATVQLNGKSVYVTGANGKGKSSFIQTVFTTIGAEKSPVKAIMEGEHKAKISLVIGNAEKDIYIEKVFTAASPQGKLIVKSPEGEIYPKPATFLEELIGSVWFDMERFLQLKNEKEMLKFLKDFLKIDSDALDEKYDNAYKSRTEANRTLKLRTAQLDGLAAIQEVVVPDATQMQVDKQNYDAVVSTISDFESRLYKGNLLVEQENVEIVRLDREEQELLEKIKRLAERRTEIKAKVQAYNETIAAYTKEKETFVTTLEGMEDPSAKMQQYADLVTKKAEYDKKVELKAEVDRLEDNALELDNTVKALAEEREPGILKQCKKIIAMGGAVNIHGNITPVAEFNVFYDAQSAAKVFKATDNILLAPLDITTSMVFTAEDMENRFKHINHSTKQEFARELTKFTIGTNMMFRETAYEKGFFVQPHKHTCYNALHLFVIIV